MGLESGLFGPLLSAEGRACHSERVRVESLLLSENARFTTSTSWTAGFTQVSLRVSLKFAWLKRSGMC